MTKRIVRNVIQCLLCDDVIESKDVKELTWCECHSCFVTGGLEFQQVGGTKRDLSRIMLNLLETEELDNELDIKE